MADWSIYPFLRPTGALISGILLKEALGARPISAWEIVLFGAVIFVIYLALIWLYRSYRIGHLILVVTIISFSYMGFASACIWELLHKPHFQVADLRKVSAYTASIQSQPSPTAKAIRYEVLIDQMKQDSGWTNAQQQAILYFLGDSTSKYRYGDKLLIKGSPDFVQHNTNPHAFNYGKYLQRRGIYLQDFVKGEHTVFIGATQEWSIERWSMQLGDYLEEVMQQYISGPRELQLAKAMVLGRREEISSEMEFAYQSTGTSHILAVSGLHVGIIYLIFSYLFRFLKNRKRWMHDGIILLAIWSFAFITGLSPSVQRASFMLSLFLAAGLLSRRSNSYSAILVSAFVMLLFSPNLLFSVSFQLSYLAVFGIIYIYDAVYGLLYFKNRFTDFFWKITSVSVAVQIATFPVTIYYFKQFPTFFFLTNLVAIPTALIVLGGSISLFVLSFSDVLAGFIGKIVALWLYGYNEVLVFLSRFSLTSIEDLQLRSYVVFALLACVFLLIRLLKKREVAVFQLLVVVLITFATIRISDSYKRMNQKKLILYDVYDSFYFDLFVGKDCYTNAINNKAHQSTIQYNIVPNRIYHAIKNVQSADSSAIIRTPDGNFLMRLNGKNMLVLHDAGAFRAQFDKLELNCLTVNKRALKQINTILPDLSIDVLVLDNSISEWEFRRLTNGTSFPFLVHSVSKDGAYIVDI